MSEGGSGGKKGLSDLTNVEDNFDAYKEAAKNFEVGSTTLKKGKKVKEKAKNGDKTA